MAVFSRGCVITTRAVCFYVGYMSLITGLINVGLQLLVLGISSNGFQCDVDNSRLQVLHYPWLGPFFVFINFGTHGFWPVPAKLSEGSFINYHPSNIQCYPGMIHVNLIDVVCVLINIIWVRFVFSYVKALHKHDLGPMRLFSSLYALKWVIQFMFLIIAPTSLHQQLYFPNFWLLKIMDLGVSFVFAMCVQGHFCHQKYGDVNEPNINGKNDSPPSYFEYLRSTIQQKEKKDAEVYEKKGTDVVVPVEVSKIIDEPKTNV